MYSKRRASGNGGNRELKLKETESGNGRRQTKSIYYGLGPVEKLVSEIIGVYVNR